MERRQERKIWEHNYVVPLLIATAVLAVLLILLIVLPGKDEPLPMFSEETGTTTDTESLPEETKPTVPAVSFRADLSAYEDAMNPKNCEEYLILVNKTHPVDENMRPDDLVSVLDARKSIELRADVERALEAMFLEMRAEGFRGIYVTSAYRSYSYQTSLFSYYMSVEKNADRSLSDEEAREKVLRYSAAPGTSEHQTGLCVDLMIDPMRELDESFADYPVYAWLCENAWKFGFILRFPADKVEITGYDYEPWHYRFVGREAAYEIYSRKLCLEEYLAK